MENTDRYLKRGVSSKKEDVHAATKSLNKGLFPNAFCSIYPDLLGNDEKMINVMHADGAGTKSILAYLYWKETGDLSVWEGIARDAIVMNLDDLLCVGVHDQILFSSTIDRNKNLIPADILETIIRGSQAFFDSMKAFGIHIQYMGGETADVGDLVKTIAVNGTMTARWPKSKLITNEKIKAGDVIVGLAGFGKASYESEYNSGIGSNGLTSARHDLLHKTYGARFQESYDTTLDEQVVYTGPHRVTDEVEVDGSNMEIGKLMLSPTRTFAPIISEILRTHFDAVHGLIHCSGGGQTKCLNYLPAHVKVMKDNLFEPPILFQLIKNASGADDREMFQVFNMGTRMEIYTTEKDAAKLIGISNKFNVDARIIGRVESGEKELIIKNAGAELIYQ